VGLKAQQIAFFEDIATAMIMQIKQRAEHQLRQALTHTVIGRPVNFQAIGGEQSNQQATDILTVAAKRAGFLEVDFLFEPLAAGID
ncbi:molecular chaperone, partial [Pseudoalteromonas ruthenica]